MVVVFHKVGYCAAMSTRPGPLAQSIAAEVRAELGRQNKSRRWLAEQINQSHVTVSRWVNGDGPVSLDSLDAMCKALGISVADLLAAVERHRAADTSTGAGRDTHGHGQLTLELAAA